MREPTQEQKKQYQKFRWDLPRSIGLPEDVRLLRRIADAVFLQGGQDKWLDTVTVHQLCLDAGLHDAVGPIKLVHLPWCV